MMFVFKNLKLFVGIGFYSFICIIDFNVKMNKLRLTQLLYVYMKFLPRVDAKI